MIWQLQEVKNRLSEGPQTITRHGRAAVVVGDAEQYARETQQEKLSTILRKCAVKGWKITHDKDRVRTIHFQ